MAGYQLSKSTFMYGVQCDKLLYLNKHHRHLKDPVSPDLQAVFTRGKNIGLLAQQCFPGGKDASPVSYFRMMDAVKTTRDLIHQGHTIIYEATFLFEGVLAALDILVKEDDGWKGYEVKSSTKISNAYLLDAALQYYVIKGSGIELEDFSLMHLNKNYIRQENLDLKQLFATHSVKELCEKIGILLPEEIERFKQLLQGDSIPEKDIGPHCTDPYDCNFKGHCWKHVPEYSIFNITNLPASKAFEWYRKGALLLEQLDPKIHKLTKHQAIQVKSEQAKRPHLEKEKLENFIRQLQYPLHFLHIGTFNPATPLFPGTRPYQSIAFQYSLHVREEPEDDKPLHRDFLAEDGSDPRGLFIEQLLMDCRSTGDILVYNLAIQKSRLQQLSQAHPQYAEVLHEIIQRLKDLKQPFSERWYHTPEMRGSDALNQVFAALVPEWNHLQVSIKDNTAASNAFEDMLNGKFVFESNQKQREQLKKYSQFKTMAMAKILYKLEERFGK